MADVGYWHLADIRGAPADIRRHEFQRARAKVALFIFLVRALSAARMAAADPAARGAASRLTPPACTSVRHNISKHCRFNNKAACTKRSIIDHQKNQTERDCCRKDEHGDSHCQQNFDMYHGQS